MVHAALNWIVNVVYPPVCAGCGRRGVWVCDRCLARHGPITSPFCPGCSLPKSVPCMCRQLPLEIDEFRAAFVYDEWVPTAVHRFKYQDESARSTSLAAAMIEPLASMGRIDALIPVSLHRDRRRERGYDQAWLLAESLANLTGVPVCECLERTRNTRPQVGQGFEDRRANVSGAFRLRAGREPAHGRRVVLVDDVRTTGATLGECAMALLPLHPTYIGAITYAAAVPAGRGKPALKP